MGKGCDIQNARHKLLYLIGSHHEDNRISVKIPSKYAGDSHVQNIASREAPAQLRYIRADAHFLYRDTFSQYHISEQAESTVTSDKTISAVNSKYRLQTS